MDGRTTEDLSKDRFLETAKWEDLNIDCLAKAFEKVGMEALMNNVPLVCKSWYKASLCPQSWKVLDFEYARAWRTPEAAILFRAVQLSKVIKLAVNRSQRMATKVVLPIHNWEWDLEGTIVSISEGCPALKSLILPEMLYHSEGEFIPKLINRWKDLEFLSLSCKYPYEEFLTQIHEHCKKFAGLTTRGRVSSAEASSIVTLLPNITYLTLIRSDLSREDLLLILLRCKELGLLNITIFAGFDADNVEISRMASHI